jgi:hypothetical protein
MGALYALALTLPVARAFELAAWRGGAGMTAAGRSRSGRPLGGRDQARWAGGPAVSPALTPVWFSRTERSGGSPMHGGRGAGHDGLMSARTEAEIAALLERGEERGCVELSELEDLTETLELDEAALERLDEALDARGIDVELCVPRSHRRGSATAISRRRPSMHSSCS